MENNKGVIKSYVVRTGRMTRGQQNAFDTLQPLYCIPFKDEEIDYIGFGSEGRPVILEIGFGMGKGTAVIADSFPNLFFIGVEVYPPGVGSLLCEITHRKLTNLRIIRHDAVQVLEKMISVNSLAGIHIFFPDPWPKKRHKKRRLIQPEFIESVADRIKPGGYIYIVTDWEDYSRQIYDILSHTNSFTNPYVRFAAPVPWRPETSFEKKGLEKNHTIFEFYFIKIPR